MTEAVAEILRELAGLIIELAEELERAEDDLDT